MNLLTVQEVANLLKKDINTLYIWLRSGKLKGYKVGGEWRVMESDLIEFITKGEKN